MNFTIVKKETKALSNKIDRVINSLVSDTEKDIKLMAKRCAFYASEYTLPFSTKTNDWPDKQTKQRIKKDTASTFATSDQSNWQSHIYPLVLRVAPNQAKVWWTLVRNERKGIESNSKLPKKTSDEYLKGIRAVPRKASFEDLQDNPTGWKYYHKEPVAFLTPQRFNAFLRQRERSALLAKAGWYAAAVSIGGQTNYNNSKNPEGNFVWPSQARTVVSKYGKGIGSGMTTIVAPGKAVFTIKNNVRYVDSAFTETSKEKTIQNTKNAMRIIMEQRVKALSEKTKQKTA